MGYRFDDRTGEFKSVNDNRMGELKSTQFCYNCGGPLPTCANFCPRCRTKVLAISNSQQTKNGTTTIRTSLKLNAIKAPKRVRLASELRITKSIMPWGASCIVIPGSSKEINHDAFSNQLHLKQIEVSRTNKWFKAVDGILFNNDLTCLIKYPCEREDKVYIVPESVIRIFPYAFECCDNLRKLVLPKGLQEIGAYAFEGIPLSLIHMQIPSSTVIQKGGHATRKLRRIQIKQK